MLILPGCELASACSPLLPGVFWQVLATWRRPALVRVLLSGQAMEQVAGGEYMWRGDWLWSSRNCQGVCALRVHSWARDDVVDQDWSESHVVGQLAEVVQYVCVWHHILKKGQSLAGVISSRMTSAMSNRPLGSGAARLALFDPGVVFAPPVTRMMCRSTLGISLQAGSVSHRKQCDTGAPS